MVVKKILCFLLLALAFASCKDSLDIEIEVVSQNGNEVQFKGLESSGASVLKWQWDFGVDDDPDVDDISLERSPKFVFPSPGTYNVKLRALSKSGWSETNQIISTCPTSLRIEFKPICNGIEVILHDGNFVKDVSIDGANRSLSKLNTSDSTFEFSTDLTGNHLIRLRIAPMGCDLPIDTSINFVINTPPIAAFSSSHFGNSVDFRDLSSGSISYWYWDFGDGNISRQRTPTHTYLSADTHLVTLITSPPCGVPDTVVHFVIIREDINEPFQTPYEPGGVFTVEGSQLISVEPYSYEVSGDTIPFPQHSDQLPIYLPPRSEQLDTHYVEPYFQWNLIPNISNYMVVISSDRITVRNGSIQNPEDLVWGWNNGLSEGELGKVRYADGRIFLNGELQYDTPPSSALHQGDTYYWCIYAWNDNFTKVAYCSREFPFIAWKRN